MQAQDYVKLAYQHAFGCGHLIDDPASCLAMLKMERAGDPSVSFEDIGNGLARMHFGTDGAALSDDTVRTMFVYTANAFLPDTPAFENALRALTALADAGRVTVSGEQMTAYLDRYRRQGCPAEHHSPAYRAAYMPRYRVVSDVFARFAELFARIDRLLNEKPRVFAAIDGMCASGKTTLAKALEAVYGACVLHMDDFYLPHEKKTPERLRMPGGNADHERFLKEALMPLTKGEPFVYRPYSCAEGALLPPRSCVPGRVNIVEGAYSLYPTLRAHYDIKAFLECNAQTQAKRILARDGEDALSCFQNLWIPLEHAYFEAFDVRAACDFVYTV